MRGHGFDRRCCFVPDAKWPADVIQENITSTTYMDSRNNTTNYSTTKIKLVANALGTGSNDGLLTAGTLRLPTHLESIPAADVVSAKIYFYNYGILRRRTLSPTPRLTLCRTWYCTL